MNLPPKEQSFEIDYVGENTEKHYQGRFTVRTVLTIGQKHMLELEKTRLLGSYSQPTLELTGLSTVLANLRLKIVDGPEWWQQSGGGSEILDEGVLVEIYNKIKEAESAWKESLKEKGKKAQDLQKDPSQ